MPGTPTNIQTTVNPGTGNVLITWGPPDILGGTLVSYHVEATHTGKGINVELYIYKIIHAK